MKTTLINVLFLACYSIQPLSARSQQIATVAVDIRGSAPPLAGLYRCAREMDEKPYVKERAQSCLDAILRSRYFERGEISRERTLDGKILLTFKLEARPLVLTEVRFEGADIDLKELQTWVAKDPSNPRPGRVYNWDGASGIYPAIKQYFAVRGRLIELSPIVYLDYKSGTARLVFQIIRGPVVVPRPAMPPYDDETLCDKRIGTEDWSDIDEYVPLPLARDLVRFGFWSCFSAQAVASDQAALERSGAFEHVEVQLKGNRDYPQVSFVLRGKQLTIENVDVQTYGHPECAPQVSISDLALKSGEIYTRAKAEETLEYLQGLHVSPGCTVEILEHDQVASPGRLRVTFNVLAYREQQVFINGERVVENEERTTH